MALAQDIQQVIHIFMTAYVAVSIVFAVGRSIGRAIREAS